MATLRRRVDEADPGGVVEARRAPDDQGVDDDPLTREEGGDVEEDGSGDAAREAHAFAGGATTTDAPRVRGSLKNRIVDLALDDLAPHAMNPNKETSDTFNRLSELLEEDGPDQPLIVVPIPDAPAEGPHYRIIKGEHRWRAARVLGWATFPAVVRSEWKDDVTQVSRMVSDNVVRGQIEKEKLTEVVRFFRREHQIDSDLASALMGFDSTKEMYKHMVRDQKAKTADDKAVVDKAKGAMKVLDDLALVLNSLFTKYGHTLQHGYMAFMWGGQLNVMVEMDDTLAAAMKTLCEISADRKIDINILLSQILADTLPTYRTAWSKSAPIESEGGGDGSASVDDPLP